jgi:hypothetical protein
MGEPCTGWFSNGSTASCCALAFEFGRTDLAEGRILVVPFALRARAERQPYKCDCRYLMLIVRRATASAGTSLPSV